MIEIAIVIVISTILLSMGGLGYYTIFRLTQSNTQKSFETYAKAQEMERKFLEVHMIISGLDKRFRDLETEIRLQKNDSHRLTEWLDKRDIQLTRLQDEFLKAQKITERESKIVELGEQLRLITKK